MMKYTQLEIPDVFLIKFKSIRINEIAMVYGILAYAVVYMHTKSIEGAIDPYSLNLSSHILTEILHMLFSTVVPSFFILWGYLSHKYLSDFDNSPFEYLKNKILHFWPIYIVFSGFYIANIVLRHDINELLPLDTLIFSIIGFGNFFGSHIMVPLSLSLCVVFFLKFFKNNRNILILYVGFVFIAGNFLPDQPTSKILANLFFHLAFCIGILIKEFDLLSFNSKRFLTKFLCLVGISIYILAVLGNNLFYTRFPNSYGHLLISISVLIIGYNLIHIFFLYIPIFFKQVLCTIGNYAFAHMIIHIHVMNMFNTLGHVFLIHPVVIQVVSFTTTPIISIYIIFPVYNYFESMIMDRIKNVSYKS